MRGCWHYQSSKLSQTPETITVEEVATQFDAELLLVTCEATSENQAGEISGFVAET